MIKRNSPLQPKLLEWKPKKKENRELWEIVLEYSKENSGQYVADLSHFTRWDVQGKTIDKMKPVGLKIPKNPGEAHFSKSVLINRMNGIQASVWHFSKKTPKFPNPIKAPLYTEITDNSVALAIFGPKTFLITEKLSSLDFTNPTKKTPFLLQGLISHLPAQITVLSKSSNIDQEDSLDGLIFTVSRGYADALFHAVMEAGEEFDLQLCGENKFIQWLKKVTK